MNIIKFNTISSTSDFLKDLSKNKTVENFTTVVADLQTKGRGQRNSRWNSEDGENLLFTVYANTKGMRMSLLPYVNFLVALILHKTILNFVKNPQALKIKWPNDIMSYNSKMAGVLVEHTILKFFADNTFVGIGLNVNQTEFPKDLKKATSMALLSGQKFDRDEILTFFLKELTPVLNVMYLEKNKERIKEDYLSVLYKKNTPAMFKDSTGDVFMGKIVDVTNTGLLVLEKENELTYKFEVKQISFL